MPCAVIFDMDGVVVDSEPLHERAFLEVVKQIGYNETHGIHFPDYIGRSERDLWLDFVSRNKPAEPIEDLLAMKRQRVIEILRREQPLFEGLPDLVRRLAARFRLGLASGSDRGVVEEVLTFRDLGQFFSAVVTGADVKRGKPAPDIFLRTAELLNIPAHDCWVIEDSRPGVEAGLAAGMQVIAITNTHSAEEISRATHVVKTYREIEGLLLRR